MNDVFQCIVICIEKLENIQCNDHRDMGPPTHQQETGEKLSKSIGVIHIHIASIVRTFVVECKIFHVRYRQGK